MRGVNKVFLLGNVGNDPEVKYSQSGTAFASTSLATSRKWKDGNGNEQEKTDWHRLRVVGKSAEVFGEYVKKGTLLFVEGRIEYGSYENKDGVTVYTTDIFVNEFQMLGSRGERGERGGGGYQRRERDEPRRQPRDSSSALERFADSDPLEDSDIPF